MCSDKSHTTKSRLCQWPPKASLKQVHGLLTETKFCTSEPLGCCSVLLLLFLVCLFVFVFFFVGVFLGGGGGGIFCCVFFFVVLFLFLFFRGGGGGASWDAFLFFHTKGFVIVFGGLFGYFGYFISLLLACFQQKPELCEWSQEVVLLPLQD